MKFFSLVGAAIVACAATSDSSTRRRPALKNIVQTAQDTPELSMLVGALAKANLVDGLSADGPFTVFAPTNDAFAAIQDTVDGLTIQQLTEVLEYHVIVNVNAKSTDLSNKQELQPLFLGHKLSVDLSNAVKIRGETNTVTVTTADVLCSNGVVHIVNAVLVPNSLRTIVDFAVASPMLSSLVGALQTANLVDALSGPGPFTVFAPTNDAFAAISSIVDGLTVEQLTEVLEYHVITGVAAKSTDLSKNQQLETLFNGHELTVNIHQSGCGGVCLLGETNRVNVILANQVCSNGVIHIVDAVIVPLLAGTQTMQPGIPMPTMNIVETAQLFPDLSSLVGAVVSADLVETLSGPGPFTVFAPTNAAFDAISSVVAGLTKKQLVEVLENHVLSGAFKATDLNDGGVLLPLFNGHTLTVDIAFNYCAGDVARASDLDYYCRPCDCRPRTGRSCKGFSNLDYCEVKIQSETVSVKVTIGDIACTNGVVHVVDAVLVPDRLAVV